jgi:hypothetical protein
MTVTAMETGDMLGRCFASEFVLRNCDDKTRGL